MSCKLWPETLQWLRELRNSTEAVLLTPKLLRDPEEDWLFGSLYALMMESSPPPPESW